VRALADDISELTFEVKPLCSIGFIRKSGDKQPHKIIKGLSENKTITNQDFCHPMTVSWFKLIAEPSLNHLKKLFTMCK
jgi:hypothetical protein